MKQAWIFVLALPLASSGCVLLGDRGNLDLPDSLPVTPPPAVSAERISKQNAHEMSQALWDEMDRDTPGLAPQANLPTNPSRQK